jgi:hypothetical protein
MTPAEQPTGFEGGREFRLPRHYLWTGITCTTFFLTAGVVSAWAAWTNVDGSFPHHKETAVFFGVFWGAFTLLGVWIMWAYHHERLIVSPDEVTMVGSFSTRSVRTADVTRVVWKVFGGKLTLHSPETRVAIWLQNFPEMAELRAFFRQAWPADIQEGWEKFEEVYAPPPPVKAQRTRFALVWMYASLAVFGVGFVTIGVCDPNNDPIERWKHLILGAVNLAVAAWVFRLSRRRAKAPVEPT